MASVTPEMLTAWREEMSMMVRVGLQEGFAAQVGAATAQAAPGDPFSEDEGNHRGATRRGREVGGSQMFITTKHSKLDVFKGDATSWTLWSFAFKRLVRSQNKGLFKEMVRAESMTDEYQEDTDLPMDLESLSGPLYGNLCNLLGDEPLGMVSAVDDCEGVRAWQVLHRKYSPRTMARGVRLLAEVTRPGRIKDLKAFEAGLANWEDQVKTLKLQSSEDLSNWMKVAI